KLNASADAERISKTGLAEAEKIMAIGKSTAEAYELQVKAMGGDNFTKYKITEEIGKGQIKVIPDILIGGGNGTDGGINGLLGMKLMQMMDKKTPEDPKTN
ncbi:MAG TPA: flotillin family protein, partial [Ginsengibacter sp.]